MGEERPTLDTVAAAAGVSRMTVSNAYNRPDQLSAATRERVLSVAATLGYGGPDPAGSSLRRGRAGSVGVLLSEDLAYAFTDPGLVAFMSGLASELGAAGQAVLLVPAESDHDGSLVRSAIVDAFILCSLDDSDPVTAAVLARRLPVVAAGSPRISGVPFVGVDNRAAGASVAQHLLDLGHRRFGVVTLLPRRRAETSLRGASPRAGIRQRVDGFVQRLREAGVTDDAVTVTAAPENTVASGAATAQPLMTGGARPTAVFAVTDVLALGVIEAARRAGRAVPHDLSVAGFDDIAESRRCDPPLTTVAQSLREQGVHAARLALALIEGRTVRPPRIVAELVVRESTASPVSRPGRTRSPGR